MSTKMQGIASVVLVIFGWALALLLAGLLLVHLCYLHSPLRVMPWPQHCCKVGPDDIKNSSQQLCLFRQLPTVATPGML